MQNWDDTLYPPFRATIRGSYYGIVTEDFIDEECYNLARRAISAFKFPRISTDYETYYANRSAEGVLTEVSPSAPNAVPHGRFTHDLGSAEIEIIIAWMKVYWCENQISNSDNFDDMYTDSNIKTFSRANAIDKYVKLMAEFRKYARDLEQRYGRVNALQQPTVGSINE